MAVILASLLGAASVQGQTTVSPPGYVIGVDLKVPYTKNPPGIDGVCKADEWKGAEKKEMSRYTRIGDLDYLNVGKGYLMLKYSDNGLYGCVDFISQKTAVRDIVVEIDIDTLQDGFPNHNPQKDDFDWVGHIVSNQPGNPIKVLTETFTNPPYFKDAVFAASISKSPNDNLSTNLQYEFSISMKSINFYNNTETNAKGFAVFANTLDKYKGYRDGLVYPWVTYESDRMARLADLSFLPETILTTSTSTTQTSQATKTTQPTTSIQKSLQTNEMTKTNAYEIIGVIFAAVVAGIAGLGLYLRRRKRK
ncbi:MAG: hypothetical protein ABSA50_08810 [Candidatus Bathyarchaeia archaeon]